MAIDNLIWGEQHGSVYGYGTNRHAQVLGPCEVWFDKTRLADALDCQTAYPGTPADIKIDTPKSTGADELSIYWPAVHIAPYNDCVAQGHHGQLLGHECSRFKR